MQGPLLSALKEHRSRLDWSQAELAESVGVSRQAIVAIEAGRQVPSTELALRLARALGCRVDELFRLREPETLTLSRHGAAGSTGRVHLGLVDDRWVAFPVEASDDTCDGVASLGARGDVVVRPLIPLDAIQRTVLVAGCAPLLGMLGQGWARATRPGRATWLPATSTRALELLQEGRVHVAGVHLVGSDAAEGHAPIVRRTFAGQSVTLVNLTRFRQGLFVPLGNPKGVLTAVDFLRDDVRSARRLPGSGAQILAERMLRESGVCAELPPGPIARSHTELASWVREGLVDVGVGIEPVAIQAGLGFVPLVEERFDLIVPERRWGDASVIAFLERIEASAFRTEVAHVRGYDMEIAGHATRVAAS